MSQGYVEDGTTTATAIQTLIAELMEQGLDPKAIGVATCSVGAAMLTMHHGIQAGGEIGHGLINSAINGDLDLYPALKAANANPPPTD